MSLRAFSNCRFQQNLQPKPEVMRGSYFGAPKNLTENRSRILRLHAMNRTPKTSVNDGRDFKQPITEGLVTSLGFDYASKNCRNFCLDFWCNDVGCKHARKLMDQGIGPFCIVLVTFEGSRGYPRGCYVKS